jgi:hypothetical protein
VQTGLLGAFFFLEVARIRQAHSLAALLVIAWGLLVLPADALACPVCGLASTGDNGGAYFGMTIVMSALPLAMIAGAILWVRGRAAAESADDEVAPSSDR